MKKLKVVIFCLDIYAYHCFCSVLGYLESELVDLVCNLLQSAIGSDDEEAMKFTKQIFEQAKPKKQGIKLLNLVISNSEIHIMYRYCQNEL
jgi:hypothetical protein